MEIHPLCLVLPAMSASDFQGLLADIRAKGLMHPIIRHEGKVLDGRHRLRACIEADVEPRFVDYIGTDPAGYVASSCMHRSLTASQRALIAAGFLEYEREQAKQRMSAAGAIGGKAKGKEDFPDPSAGQSRDKAGSRMNVSGRSVDDAMHVIEKATPEVLEKVRSGEMALNQAKKVVQLRPEAQRRIAETPKADRSAALQKAVNLKESAAQRSTRQPIVEQPGTPFVRKLLSGIEHLAMACAQDGAKGADAIAEKFFDEMDWNAVPLMAQLEYADGLIRALTMIRQKAKVAA